MALCGTVSYGETLASAVCSEIQKTWRRPDAAQWAEAYSALFPPYQLLIESYSKAQQVVTRHEQAGLSGSRVGETASL